MTRRLRLSIFSVLVAAGFITLVVNLLAHRSQNELAEASDWVTETHEAIRKLERVRTLVSEAESQQREFIFTMDPQYAAAYSTTKGAVSAALGEARAAIVERRQGGIAAPLGSDPELPLVDVERIVQRRLDLLDEVMVVFREDGFPAARDIMRTGSSARAMDALREAISTLHRHLQDVLEWRLAERDQSRRRAALMLVALSLATLVLLALALVAIRRYVLARDLNERALRSAERRFRAAIEGSMDAFFVLDAIRDRSGTIVDFLFTEVNSRGLGLTRTSRAALLGGRLSVLAPPGSFGKLFDAYARALGEGSSIEEEVAVERHDGPIWVRHQVVPIGDGVAVTARDVTARRQMEEDLRASLREKEALLKEVHHRVKNNLQVISSLLNLQADQLEEPRSLELFRESQRRVRSIALTHEMLYQSRTLGSVGFGDYLRTLVPEVARSFDVGGRVEVSFSVEDVPLPLDVAVPCGLMVNELVGNAMKHAFPGRRSGQVSVELRRDGSDTLLAVSDDGVGMPAGFDVGRSSTLGLQLVTGFAEQIDAKLEIVSAGGTTFRVRIPGNFGGSAAYPPVSVPASAAVRAAAAG